MTQVATCWFCGRLRFFDDLIAGYDTWDEQRLACSDCDRMLKAMAHRGWWFARINADPLYEPEPDPEPDPPPANRLSTAPRLVAPVLAALVLAVLALLAVYAVGWRTQ